MTTTDQEIIAISETDGAPAGLLDKIDSSWTSFIPMILIFIVFYFLIIRPQEKRRKEQENLISSVKRGEDVVTTGGIYGKVIKVNEDSTVMVEIADNLHIKIAKSAIVNILSRREDKKIEAPAKK